MNQKTKSLCRNYSTISPSKNVHQLIEQLKNPQIRVNQKQQKPPLDINLIRASIKKKWKNPGHVNIEFMKPSILRAKILSQWEYERICLAERSYKNPKNFKGIKFDCHSRKFTEPSDQMHSTKFKSYLGKVKEGYEERRFLPDETIMRRKQRIERMLTQTSRRCESLKKIQQNGYFGFSSQRRFQTLRSTEF